jgi:hypothetical protein
MKTNQPLSKEAQERLLDWKDDMHPCLLPSFYETIDCPQDNQEAELLSKCHLDAVSDIDLQIETVDLDIEMLKNQIEVTPSDDDKAEMTKRLWDIQDKKRRLLYAKRRHTSSSNAYWYFMQ